MYSFNDIYFSFKRVLKLNPKNEELLYRIASELKDLNKYDEAVEW